MQINQNGQWFTEYAGPYAGVDVSKPETLIPDNASPAFSNFMLRNAELRSRPALVKPFPGVVGAIIAPAYQVGISSFIDINGTYHTVVWVKDKLYQYDPSLLPASPWVVVGTASPSNMESNPVAYRAFANSIYYTNISQTVGKPSTGGGGAPVITPFLAYWNGIDAAPVFTQTFGDASISNSVAGISRTDSPTVGGSLPGAPTIVGPMAIGGQYIGELNNQIILANINVLDQNNGALYNFPNTIWWSANGLPKQWDPTQNTSAGFNSFLDVPDLITGLATLGIAGYIFRTNGITQFAPSGSSVTPFTFDHMWDSDHGIGNVLPWSVAQYGPQAGFVASDNIYSLSVTAAQAIGGTARDSIMADLAAMPIGSALFPQLPFAQIIPIYKAGYVYLTYNIFIPFPDHVRHWVYSFEDKNWSSWDLDIEYSPPFPTLVCAPNVV